MTKNNNVWEQQLFSRPQLRSCIFFTVLLGMMLTLVIPCQIFRPGSRRHRHWHHQGPGHRYAGRRPKTRSLNKVITTVNTIGNADGHNKIAINIMWTLITGFLVMFMQAGFAMVETGFTQKKNVAHTMAMNFMIYAIGVLGFWICGFAFHVRRRPECRQPWAAHRA